jgi:drug/metabolite transporter (DMT)-like permease
VAAVTSAVWNLLLKQARDATAASAVAVAAAAVLFAPALAFGHLPAAAGPYLAGSAVLELTYFCLLSAAYRTAELSLVFPLARGAAPVVVLVLSGTLLGARAGGWEAVGVLLVAVGAAAVRGARAGGPAVGPRPRTRRPGRLSGAALALPIACCVAGYTLVDQHGVRLASPPAYFEVVLLCIAPPYLAVAAATRGLAALRAELRPAAAVRTVALGVLMAGGYLLVLESLRLAAAAPVAAVRESSVVIGTGLAAGVLRERVGPSRWAGALLVAGGVAVLALAGP